MNEIELYRLNGSDEYKFNDGSYVIELINNKNVEIKDTFKGYKFSFAKPFLNGCALVERNEEILEGVESGDIDFLLNDGSFFIDSYVYAINPYEDSIESYVYNRSKYRCIQDFLKLYKTNNKSWENVLESLGSERNKYNRFCKTGKYFLVNLSSNKIFEKYLNWNNFIDTFQDTIKFVILKSWSVSDFNIFGDIDESLFFYLDFSHSQIIAYVPYCDAGLFNCGVAPVKEFNKDYGFISDSLKDHYKINPQFELAYHFKNDLARVMKNGKFGFVDINGNVVIDFKFADARSFNNGWAAVANFVTGNNSSFEDVDHFFSLKNDNKDNGLRWYFIDTSGNITKSYIYGLPFCELFDLEDDGVFTFKLIKMKKNTFTSLLRLEKFGDAIIRNNIKSGKFNLSKKQSLDDENKHFLNITISDGESNQKNFIKNKRSYFLWKENYKYLEFSLYTKIDSYKLYSTEFDPSIVDKFDELYDDYVLNEDFYIDYTAVNRSGLDMLNEDSDQQWNEDSY